MASNWSPMTLSRRASPSPGRRCPSTGGVLPITANQRLADLDPHSDAGQKATEFAQTLSTLLTALHNTFAGDPTAFTPARGIMGALESIGEELCATEIVVDGQPTGRNAGPTWEFVRPTP